MQLISTFVLMFLVATNPDGTADIKMLKKDFPSMEACEKLRETIKPEYQDRTRCFEMIWKADPPLVPQP